MHFVQGRCEDTISGAISRALRLSSSAGDNRSNNPRGEGVESDKNTVVGIVDPPREGLHFNVIKTIRNCMLYVLSLSLSLSLSFFGFVHEQNRDLLSLAIHINKYIYG